MQFELGDRIVTNAFEDNPDVAAARSSETAHADATLAGQEPVLVYTPANNEEADVVRATLAAAGIPALLQSPSVTTVMGAVDAVTRDTGILSIFVASSHLEAARALLNTPALSDAELTAEEEADPTTLEEAEARVKNA